MKQGRQKKPPHFRMSNIGKVSCKAWFEWNYPEYTRPPSKSLLNVFSQGDFIEIYLLALAMAAGHKISAYQEYVEVAGVKGSCDAIIDGLLIDIKSTSEQGARKFEGNLKYYKQDPFGYYPQNIGYLKGLQNHPDLVHKNHIGFLVMNKANGYILPLDIYEVKWGLDTIEDFIYKKQEMVRGEFPGRDYDDVQLGKTGNRKLGSSCKRCEFKKLCWPQIRTFLYDKGQTEEYLTHIERMPQVPEKLEDGSIRKFE